MKISVIGSGYVGLCTAAGLASLGHNVTCVDIDRAKVDKINNGKAPIFEEGLEEKLRYAISKGLLNSTTDISSAVINTEISFMAVGTPSNADGSIDLTYIRKAAEELGRSLKNKKTYHMAVVKSTVLPETTEKIILPIIEKHSGKAFGRDLGICMNPEFLREGSAMKDFLGPDRIVIGEYDKKSGDILEKLYKDFSAPILRTNIRTAEMIKYASNAFLATKISFINEIGNLCKMLNIDTNEVAKGMGYDKRISPHFLESGIGFGGSCFPKDVSAIAFKAREIGYKPDILSSVLKVNRNQPLKIIGLLRNKIDVKNKKVAVLGLSFKKGTDDVRDSPAIPIVKKLIEMKAIVQAYDPEAMEDMRKILNDITYCKNAKEALNGAYACLILTDWHEFNELSDKDFSVMSKKVIIEGRKILDKKKVSGVEGVCW